jgi:hypothetical protein
MFIRDPCLNQPISVLPNMARSKFEISNDLCHKFHVRKEFSMLSIKGSVDMITETKRFKLLDVGLL